MGIQWVTPVVAGVDLEAILKSFKYCIHCSFSWMINESHLEILLVVCKVVELIGKGVDQREEFGTDGVCLRIQDERRLNVCFLPEERVEELHGG